MENQEIVPALDLSSTVGDFAQCKAVFGLGAEMVKASGKATNSAERKKDNTVALFAAQFGSQVFADLLVAPKGEAAKEVIEYSLIKAATFDEDIKGRVIATITESEPELVEHTKRQLYDAFKLAVLEGLEDAHAKAWRKHIAKIVLTAHEALLVTPASRKISSRLKDWKKQALNRVEDETWDKLQKAELEASILEDRPEIDLKKAAQTSDRLPEVRIAELITKARDIAARDDREDIPYSCREIAAWCVNGYAILGVSAPIKEDGDS